MSKKQKIGINCYDGDLAKIGFAVNSFETYLSVKEILIHSLEWKNSRRDFLFFCLNNAGYHLEEIDYAESARESIISALDYTLGEIEFDG